MTPEQERDYREALICYNAARCGRPKLTSSLGDARFTAKWLTTGSEASVGGDVLSAVEIRVEILSFVGQTSKACLFLVEHSTLSGVR
jgi:hypothetical protein